MRAAALRLLVGVLILAGSLVGVSVAAHRVAERGWGAADSDEVPVLVPDVAPFLRVDFGSPASPDVSVRWFITRSASWVTVDDGAGGEVRFDDVYDVDVLSAVDDLVGGAADHLRVDGGVGEGDVETVMISAAGNVWVIDRSDPMVGSVRAVIEFADGHRAASES